MAVLIPGAPVVRKRYDTAMPSVSRLRRRVSFVAVIVAEREADHVAGVFSRFYQPAGRAIA
jgi:hypothetical protein